jgi:hypothetical protein
MASSLTPVAPLVAISFASLPTFLAPFRRIGKTFLVKELLLSCCPGEFLLTINAGARLVFKVTHFLLPFLKRGRTSQEVTICLLPSAVFLSAKLRMNPNDMGRPSHVINEPKYNY